MSIEIDTSDIDLTSPIRSVKTLTESALSGNGVFDVLMGAVELHIQDEYKKNRITGSNYATTYLGAMQTVLQFATQYALQQDAPFIELEKLKLERQKVAIELKLNEAELKLKEKQLEQADVELEIKRAQLEVEKEKIPLIKAQTLSEQAKTMDVIDSGVAVKDGTNIQGTIAQELAASKATVENAKKAAALSLAKTFVMDPFSTIEASEGIGASYYGLNGGNSIEYLNNLRKAYGLEPLNIDKYSGEHKKYMNHYAPDSKLETDD